MPVWLHPLPYPQCGVRALVEYCYGLALAMLPFYGGRFFVSGASLLKHLEWSDVYLPPLSRKGEVIGAAAPDRLVKLLVFIMTSLAGHLESRT